MIVGSWANNQFIDRDPVVSESFFSTTVYAKEGYYLMLEGSPTSASNLAWQVSRFLPLEKERAKAEGRSVYDLCNEAMDAVPPDASDIVFLPFLSGSNVNPAARGALIGLEGWHTRRHVMRRSTRASALPPLHIEKMEKYRPLPGVIRMAGGAARSRQWRQLFADALRRPVETTRGTELGTLGAAMCAAVCAGAYRTWARPPNGMVRAAERNEPDPAAATVFDRKYKTTCAPSRRWKGIGGADEFQ